jgi:DNA-binding MarR family transcriptional regulator
MNLARLRRQLKTLVADPSDQAAMGRLSREIGHALPAATLQELRELRADAAAIRDDLDEQAPGSTFAKGLLFGLVEMIVAYDVEVQEVAEREERRRFVLQELPRGILGHLAAGPQLPRDLVRALATSDAQVSRALRDLRALGLVDLMAPAAMSDQRTRPHRLTAEGKVLLRSLGEERSEPLSPCSATSEAQKPRVKDLKRQDPQEIPTIASRRARSAG